MRVEEIERLLAEFYEGNTSENQEEKLKKYFETQNVPEHLEKDKRLFLCFHKDVPVEVPDSSFTKHIIRQPETL